jgi:hypothetical protein
LDEKSEYAINFDVLFSLRVFLVVELIEFWALAVGLARTNVEHNIMLEYNRIFILYGSN